MPHPGPPPRCFLFLQGPHGPFFAGLALMLTAAGAECWRVGVNKGDEVFWRDRARYIPWRGTPPLWPAEAARLMDLHRITDLVLYGDTRPLHAAAIEVARSRGITVHVFEEGYMRPYWVSYERGGSNGHSRLMALGVEEMRAALAAAPFDHAEAPAHWGDLRHHMVYGAAYHFLVLFLNRGYPNFRSHRAISVGRELRLNLARLALAPALWAQRAWATRRIRTGGFPYHVALLQLAHDASFLAHSPFGTMRDFLEVVIRGFAEGAPGHHHLVFKAHPLEDGRAPLRRDIRALAAQHGVAARVHFLRGGKLGRLLDHARSAVTVNSTSAQQALWRGLPLKVFGTAVYDKPEFVSTQSLPQFFASPSRPDPSAYRDYRRFLLETSQVAGGFYSVRGRRQLLRQVVDMMLAAEDPHDALLAGRSSEKRPLRVIR